jgi:hypothetical protein
VNAVMNLQVPQNAGTLSSGYPTVLTCNLSALPLPSIDNRILIIRCKLPSPFNGLQLGVMSFGVLLIAVLQVNGSFPAVCVRESTRFPTESCALVTSRRSLYRGMRTVLSLLGNSAGIGPEACAHWGHALWFCGSESLP